MEDCSILENAGSFLSHSAFPFLNCCAGCSPLDCWWKVLTGSTQHPSLWCYATDSAVLTWEWASTNLLFWPRSVANIPWSELVMPWGKVGPAHRCLLAQWGPIQALSHQEEVNKRRIRMRRRQAYGWTSLWRGWGYPLAHRPDPTSKPVKAQLALQWSQSCISDFAGTSLSSPIRAAGALVWVRGQKPFLPTYSSPS